MSPIFLSPASVGTRKLEIVWNKHVDYDSVDLSSPLYYSLKASCEEEARKRDACLWVGVSGLRELFQRNFFSNLLSWLIAETQKARTMGMLRSNKLIVISGIAWEKGRLLFQNLRINKLFGSWKDSMKVKHFPCMWFILIQSQSGFPECCWEWPQVPPWMIVKPIPNSRNLGEQKVRSSLSGSSNHYACLHITNLYHTLLLILQSQFWAHNG